MHNIAIDGPAAGGKTTVAKILAVKLGLVYLDTGAMYRAAAWRALRDGVDLNDTLAVEKSTREMALDICADSASDCGHRITVDGQDVTASLHDTPVTQAVSKVAAIPGVRAILGQLQKDMAAKGGIIMAGRDIGTVIMPDAKFKYYLDASLEERARRRLADFKAKGKELDFEEVKRDLAERDAVDSQRSAAPLTIAEDARVIDCTNIGAQEVADLIVADYRA